MSTQFHFIELSGYTSLATDDIPLSNTSYHLAFAKYMAPKKPLPAAASPGTNLYLCSTTGEYFSSLDALFEHTVSLKIPSPGPVHKGKKGTVFTSKPVAWHERSLPKIDFVDYKTNLDLHVELTVLFLVPITPMRSLNNLVDTLFKYLQNRFIKNEKILVCIDGKWVNGKIFAVSLDGSALPQDDSLDEIGHPPSHFLYDVTVASDKTDPTLPPLDISIRVRCDQIRRGQGRFSRALLRASIVQHCKCRDPRKSDSIWSLKNKTLLLFDLNTLSWWDLFAGVEPRFSVPSKASKNFPRKQSSDIGAMVKTRPDKHRKRKSTFGHVKKGPREETKPRGSKRKLDDGHYSKDESQRKKRKSTGHSDEKDIDLLILTSAERAERKKLRQQEYKKRWREKVKQEKKKVSSAWAQLFSVGEDLECANMKALNVAPKPLDTLLPEEFIADGLFLLEFLRVFGPGIDRGCEFADIAGWDLNRLYAAFGSGSVDGELTRLLAFACKAIMSSIPKYGSEHDLASRNYSNSFQQQGAAAISSTFQRIGISFHNLPLNGAAISEVVRLCLLAACVPCRISDSKYDNSTLCLLKSTEGTALYRQLLCQSVFALSFAQRMKLVVAMFQAVVGSDTVREMLEEANAQAEEYEKMLKSLKSLNDEIIKLTGRIVVSKEKQSDKQNEKNDRFRILLDAYSRKRSGLRSDKDKSAKEIAEDIRLLNEGRKHRKLTDVDAASLKEAMDDNHAKFTARIREERTKITADIQAIHQDFRLDSIGMDRHYFRYWNIHCVSGLLIECPAGSSTSVCTAGSLTAGSLTAGSLTASSLTASSLTASCLTAGCLCEKLKAGQHGSSWWRLNSEEEITALSKILLMNGEREVALKRGLDHHLPSLKERILEMSTLPPTQTLPPHERVLPEIVSSESFDAQISSKLEAGLVALNTKLQTFRLGGIPIEAQEAWFRGEPTVKPTTMCLLTNNPSSEISAQVEKSGEEKISNDHVRTSNVEASVEVAMEATMKVDKAAMEVDKASVEVDKAVIEAPVSSLKSNEDEEKMVEDNAAGDDESSEGESGTRDEASNFDSGKKSEEISRSLPSNIQDSANVKRLYNCILRLVESVSHRCIGAPLVTIDEEFARNIIKLNMWKSSLMASLTTSQLFIHFSVFEKCILWDKSTTNAICKACRKRGDAFNIAACDRCDKRYHLDCLLPPLADIPDESWICPVCQPSTMQRNNRRARYGAFSYNEQESSQTLSSSTLTAQAVENSKVSNAPILSSRTARAMQRNQNGGYFEEFQPDEEGENSMQLASGDLRRSGRQGKRVDYKGLIQGTSQGDESEMSGLDDGDNDDDDDEDDDDVEMPDYEREKMADDCDTVSSIESDESEYDPKDSSSVVQPKWGKIHRRGKRSS